MKRSLCVLATMFVVVLLLGGCTPSKSLDANTSTDAPTQQTTQVQPTIEATATVTPTMTPAPTPEPSVDRPVGATPAPASTVPAIPDLPPEDLGAAGYTTASGQVEYITAHLGSDLPGVEEQCAYITGQSMNMDGTTEILFDYVEWLSGPEAVTQYNIDFPDADPADLDVIQEIGYIRNVNPTIRSFRTCSDSRYYILSPSDLSMIIEVDYDGFRDWLLPSSKPQFVMLCLVDDVIARVECIYLP